MNSDQPVVFKTEDTLWQMEAKCIKTWEARQFDAKDERIRRLITGHWEKDPTPGRRPSYLYDETFVCFLNKLTGQTLQFRFRGIITTDWAPGWAFIQLGDLVATYDADGNLANK